MGLIHAFIEQLKGVLEQESLIEINNFSSIKL